MSTIDIQVSDESDQRGRHEKKRKIRNGLGRANSVKAGQRDRHHTKQSTTSPEVDDDEGDVPRLSNRRQRRPSQLDEKITAARRSIRESHKSMSSFQNDLEEDELAGSFSSSQSDDSGIVFAPKPRREKSFGQAKRGSSKFQRPQKRTNNGGPTSKMSSRRSERQNKVSRNLEEVGIDDEIFADSDASIAVLTPKVISIREVFQITASTSAFARVHQQHCDVCGGRGNKSNKGLSDLIYCQGCSCSIHKVCLGYRSNREHMVTKIGPQNFVMQCRRCIGTAKKKDDFAPRLDMCQHCHESGKACAAFSIKRTTKQEEKLRAENEGEDPITNVESTLINNASIVLFRCTHCQRGWHYEHLPPLVDNSKAAENAGDLQSIQSARLRDYNDTWACADCRVISDKPQTIVAWRPVERDAYTDDKSIYDFSEDQRDYLLKWQDKSYFACTWMPGAWVWGLVPGAMRRGFLRKDEDDALAPKFTTEEAIPEEYLRIEIVLDVASNFRAKSRSHDLERATDIVEVLVKFQGLGYDEVVWEKPPSPQNTDRWEAFVAAYDEYLAGIYFKSDTFVAIKERIKRFRELDFETKIELKKQPSNLTGGQLMSYQLEGLNWLLWNFYQEKNVILADEMGLGKTVQIVSFFAALLQKPRCWPFLVVTPNSTCPNWRREIKRWAPGLRVVAFYGGKKAREMAMEYELFPNDASDLRAHVVVTSYEAPIHETAFFKKIKWAGMVVDEGQRLKNDENLLYGALQSLKIPFRVLLTGTPLQNNKRELFNLLQFLNEEIDAESLDMEYTELTKENLPKLHALIRPYFLRRTKLQVLKFLPSIAQVILPVSMAPLQRKLYKSILAKNPELIKAIFGQSKTLKGERGSLNNILMQLRKCLCHPFIYSSAIEERSLDEVTLHRNLVDASAKFKLLDIMLPKLRARGHRVLLFSQFLGQLDLAEDFLNGINLPFGRLDGSINALEKQKRIDAFNAEGSDLFAFLLSTRAGGVGINLATADTVIIMDPDFNPHQDMQALSRAHRIGQKNKVLVFQLMTKDSVEEKIMQIGRKKMALDHALIESMDADEDAGADLESILKHGAAALFADDDDGEIVYDSKAVDLLLDRAQIEVKNTETDKSADSQFSYARVWANDKADLADNIGTSDEDVAPLSEELWTQIIKQREADAALEAASKTQDFGRGKRRKHVCISSVRLIVGGLHEIRM